MSGYPSHVWEQLKNITADELTRALLNDGFRSEGRRGGTLSYYNPANRRRVTIHYHPGKTFGPKLLKKLISAIGWNIADLKRLKLIK